MHQSSEYYLSTPEVFCLVCLNQSTLPGLTLRFDISKGLCTYVVIELSQIP